MARIRSVKPELRTSEVVASWPFEVRYFFVLLWGYLDDKGRGLDVPKTIAGDCFPHDERVTSSTVDKWLTLMARTKLDPDKQPPICRYEVGGRRYVHCTNWREHQRPNRPTGSRIPPCPIHEPLTEPPSEPLSEGLSEGLIERAQRDSVPGAGEQGSRGAGEQGSRGAGEQGSRGAAKPRCESRREPPTDGEPGTAEQLIRGWLDSCRRPPPSTTVNDVGRQVAALLRDGIDPADVAEGLRLWQARGLNPSVLPSVVNQIMNSAPPSNVVALAARATPRPSTTDRAFGEALALAAELRAEETTS